jgi:hypothetical protein
MAEIDIEKKDGKWVAPKGEFLMVHYSEDLDPLDAGPDFESPIEISKDKDLLLQEARKLKRAFSHAIVYDDKGEKITA